MGSKVLGSATGTTSGASIVFPAKVNFKYSILHLAGKTDLATDIEVLDDTTVIYRVAQGVGGFDIPLDGGDGKGKFFGRKNKTFTCRIATSTATCEIYASARFD